MLIIKTTKNVYGTLEKTIIALHPYELPEIIAIPIENGSDGYLKWISDWISKKDNKNVN